MRFDRGYIYDSQLNEHNEEMREFWSPENDEQLALQKKKQEDAIVRGRKEAVGDVVAGAATKGEGLLADSDDESYLSSFEDDASLIPPKPRNPPVTGSFPLEDDSDHAPTLEAQARKPRGNAPAPPPSDRETRSMTGSSKPRLRYMNGVAPSYQHMHKVLNALQSGDYLGPSKGQEPQTYRAALASPESAHWIKAIQSEYDSLIENETWDLTELPSDRKVLTGQWVLKIKYD